MEAVYIFQKYKKKTVTLMKKKIEKSKKVENFLLIPRSGYS